MPTPTDPAPAPGPEDEDDQPDGGPVPPPHPPADLPEHSTDGLDDEGSDDDMRRADAANGEPDASE